MSTESNPNLTEDDLTCLIWFEYNYSQPFDAPEGCIGVKVRVRYGEFVRCFLRYPDRIEQCCVVRRAGRQMPGALCGLNLRPPHTLAPWYSSEGP